MEETQPSGYIDSCRNEVTYKHGDFNLIDLERIIRDAFYNSDPRRRIFYGYVPPSQEEDDDQIIK